MWGKSSYISFLRIPCSLIYRIVQYICYVWVWFVDLIYALLNSFGICWLCFGLCALRFIFYSSFLLVVGEKSVISFFVFCCGFYVWLFICNLFDCLWEVFDFLWTVFFRGILFWFSRLFIWSRFLVPPLISI